MAVPSSEWVATRWIYQLRFGFSGVFGVKNYQHIEGDNPTCLPNSSVPGLLPAVRALIRWRIRQHFPTTARCSPSRWTERHCKPLRAIEGRYSC